MSFRSLTSLSRLQGPLTRLLKDTNTPCRYRGSIRFRQGSTTTSNHLAIPGAAHLSTLSPEALFAPTEQTPESKSRLARSYGHGLTLHHLMDARVHMGHRRRLYNPHMAPYIFGHRNGMHVIDLDKTLIMLRRALAVVSKMAENGCTFLWLGPHDTKKHRLMVKIAKEAQVYTLDGRWVGGTLTNGLESGQAEKLGYRLPDCLFVVDTLRHAPALKEAKRMGIITIGVVDSDCDPREVVYAIPGNDEGAHALNLYFQLMKLAIQDGRKAANNNPSRRRMGVPTARDRHGNRNR